MTDLLLYTLIGTIVKPVVVTFPIRYFNSEACKRSLRERVGSYDAGVLDTCHGGMVALVKYAPPL